MRELPSCPSTTNTNGCCIIGKLGLHTTDEIINECLTIGR